jgi:hypothetical protein
VTSLRGLLDSALARLAEVGAEPVDDEETRLQKALLVLIAILILPIAGIWAVLYLAFGAWTGWVAVLYAIISVASIAVFAWTRDFGLLLNIQLLDIAMAPTLSMIIAPTRASPGVVRMLMRATALTLLLQLAGCGTSDRVAQLWAYPEAELSPVGSTVLDKRERPARMTIEGRDTASWAMLGAQEDPAAIEDFYARELISRGWQEPTDLPAIGLRVRTSTELLGRSWRKGDVVFRLGVLNPADPAAEGPSEGFGSVFRIDLVDRPIDPKAS